MAEARVLQGSTASWALTNGRPEVSLRAVPAGRIRPARLRTSTQRSAEQIIGPVAVRLEERSPERPLTLTRRGRLLLVGLPIALGVAALILLGAFLTSQARAGESLPASSPTVEVSVAAGESLWDLALRHAPDRDPRDVVAEMVELNNLRGSVVQAGQSIAVPVGG
jgi:hypothetical protein